MGEEAVPTDVTGLAIYVGQLGKGIDHLVQGFDELKTTLGGIAQQQTSILVEQATIKSDHAALAKDHAEYKLTVAKQFEDIKPEKGRGLVVVGIIVAGLLSVAAILVDFVH